MPCRNKAHNKTPRYPAGIKLITRRPSAPHEYDHEQNFEIFEKIQGFSEADFKKLEFDYKYAQKLLEKSAVKTDEDKYNACVMYFISISEYKEINKKEPDLEARMKIINMLLPEERKNEHNNNQEKEVKNK